jgi:hypothetical protein
VIAATRGAGCQFDVAVTRWQNFTGQTATLEATGEAFESKSVAAIGIPPSDRRGAPHGFAYWPNFGQAPRLIS